MITDSRRPVSGDCNALQAASQANYLPGNKQRENTVALSMCYSYHGSMTFSTAAKRYGCGTPLSQLKAALCAGVVVT